jgi:hypothetical protein
MGQGSGGDLGVRLSITVGGSQSESRYENSSTGLAGSLLKAGGNLNLPASGAGLNRIDLLPTNRAVSFRDFRLQDGQAGTRRESGRPANCAA